MRRFLCCGYLSGRFGLLWDWDFCGCWRTVRWRFPEGWRTVDTGRMA